MMPMRSIRLAGYEPPSTPRIWSRRSLADLDTRLQEAQSGRARAEARCRELTSEVERLSAAGEALEALESLVKRNP